MAGGSGSGGGGGHVAPTSGDVLLFHAGRLEAVNVVTAHRAPLSAVALNAAGTLLATASDTGTIVRVFGVPRADTLYQFRRGTVPARIQALAFNPAASLLCVASASDTVHVFRLGGNGNGAGSHPPRRASGAAYASPPASPGFGRAPRAAAERSPSPAASDLQSEGASTAAAAAAAGVDGEGGEEGAASMAGRRPDGTLLGLLRRTSQTVGSRLAQRAGAYLPSAVAAMWEPARDFAWCKIPRAGGGGGPRDGSAGAGAGGGEGQNVGGAGAAGSAGLRSVVAMSGNSPQVMVVTNEGRFYVFGIDLEKGGEGALVKVYEVGAESERLGPAGGED